MTTEDRRLAWVLRAYPKAYREHRADEIVGTLEASMAPGAHLSRRDAASLLGHAAGLRLRQLRPGTLLLALALLGAALGAGTSLLSGPTHYGASARLLPAAGPAHAATAPPRPETLAQDVTRVLDTSSPTAFAFSGPWSQVRRWVSCSQALTSGEVVVTCRSDQADRAQVAVGAITAQVARLVVEGERSYAARHLSWIAVSLSLSRQGLVQAEQQLALMSRSDPLYAWDHDKVEWVRNGITQDLVTERALRARLADASPGFSVVGGTWQTRPPIAASDVVLGALGGLLVGGAVLAARRRRRHELVAA